MIVWKLDALLRARNVKGRELARRMEIGENYLSRVRHEVPDRLSLSLLDALCRELDCGLDELLEYRPDAPKPAARPRKPKAAAAVAVSDDALMAVVAQALAEADEEEPAPEPTADAEPTAGSEPAAAPAPSAEPEPAPEPPAEAGSPPAGAVVQTSALQARLERLKRLRSR